MLSKIIRKTFLSAESFSAKNTQNHKLTYSKTCVIPLFHTGHESPWIDFLFIRGDSWGFIEKILQSWCSTSQSWFRYDVVTNIWWDRLNLAWIAQEFITISIITLEHAARKLGINYKSVKNMRNAARIGHELTEIRDDSWDFLSR